MLGACRLTIMCSSMFFFSFLSIIFKVFYIKSNFNNDIIIVRLYMDNLISIEICQQMFKDFKETMPQQIETRDMRLMSYSLRIEIQ